MSGYRHPATDERRPPAGTGRRVAEIGITVALSLVLGFWSFAPVPHGGQVSLDLVPLLVLSRVRGLASGLVAGALYGALHALQEPIVLHPIQGFLDYPLAFGLLGVAGVLPPGGRWDVPGVILAVGARMVAHVLSGVFFLHLFVPVDQMPASPLLYSLIYNATWLVPAGLLAGLLVPILTRRAQP